MGVVGLLYSSTSPVNFPGPESPLTTPSMFNTTGAVPAVVTHFVKMTSPPATSLRLSDAATCIPPRDDRTATNTSDEITFQFLKFYILSHSFIYFLFFF